MAMLRPGSMSALQHSVTELWCAVSQRNVQTYWDALFIIRNGFVKVNSIFPPALVMEKKEKSAASTGLFAKPKTDSPDPVMCSPLHILLLCVCGL